MTSDALSLTFNALADPTRRAMLTQLASGDANVSELAEPFLSIMSRPAVTKHLQVLERAGLISKTKDAQRRQCAIKPEALKVAADWIEQYRQFWEESFDRLDAYLKSVAPPSPTKKGTKRGRKTKGQ
ncbi:MAG: metalloregulator ArsR/SmtB family transcription factor [Tepidisphaeraceae bacterium]